MSDPHGIATRIFRLAYLITGDGAAAGRVTGSVLRRPGTLAAESHRLDRMTILECRRATPSDGRPRAAASADADPPAPGAGLGRLAGLGGQAREAWILVRVFGQSLRDAARSMDCSRTAVRRHLRLADAGIVGRPVPLTAAATPVEVTPEDAAALSSLVAEIRSTVRRLAPPSMLVRRHHRRRRVRRWGRIVLLVLGSAAAVAGGLAIARMVAEHRAPAPASPDDPPADRSAASPAAPPTDPASIEEPRP